MIHESGVWSDVHRRWFFLPRRCSKEQYNESLDEHRGCSVLITANEDLYDIKTTQILNAKPTRGFSSFKFIPSSEDQVIVALRTEELEGKTATYVTAFKINGEVLLDDFHTTGLLPSIPSLSALVGCCGVSTSSARDGNPVRSPTHKNYSRASPAVTSFIRKLLSVTAV
jgi:hypothetical protein